MLNWLRDFIQDARYGARMLLKSPGFTLVAVLSLALGIGAGTAVFSLVNAILLASLPVPNPQQLRVLEWSGLGPKNGPFTGAMSNISVVETERIKADAFTYPQFTELRQSCTGVADVFGYYPIDQVMLRGRREANTANGLLVSDHFFSALGLKPLLGRLPDPAEHAPGGTPVVVIGYRLWQNEFALDPQVIGQQLILNSQPYTIVGVLARGFIGVDPGRDTGFYVTLAAQPQLASRWSPVAADRWWFKLMARLKPGASEAQFQAALNTVFGRATSSVMKEPKVVVEDGRGGLDWGRESYRRPLMLLLAIVGIVILVACANLAGLSLARGAARHHEFAVRAAIGAGRWRLIRQSLAESLLLALLGGGLGVLLAAGGRTSLGRLLVGRSIVSPQYDAALDLRVLGFALAATFLAALFSGILPALRNAGADPQTGLKARAAQAAPRLRAGKSLVVGQIALSLLLLAGAGLFARTLVNLVEIDPGFKIDNLLLFRLIPRVAGYNSQQQTEFFDRVQTSMASIPGVRSAALSQFALLRGIMSGGDFTLPGHPFAEGAKPQAHRLPVGETFFDTMGIRLLNGRGFTAADRDGAPKVVVVNQTFARKYLAGGNPIGQKLNVNKTDWEIVGVCADAKYTDIKANVPPTVYFSFRQHSVGSAFIVLRTAVPPLSLVAAARRAVAAIDPNIPLAEISTQKQIRDDRLGQERLFATLCGALAGLALLLSCVGIYGLMAYNVARRTGEIGIRMALGAAPGDIAGPILREALLLSAIGVAIGLPGVYFAVRLIESQIYGVKPRDPVTLVAAAIVLILVAILAAWLPARRAARTEPMQALRSE